ncbi:aryl-alcohol dehydrogenase-like predicted oxidoreductase [Rathayibacter tanaceti]|uniref:Aryl-alcohol dehydrogenase-like predicted oxidoreductase n=1 Tax=Rathayibacter tanaceti TaxID=1671680 RepID=A0ACD2XJW1_9MICO|nr:aryl-alcohol dehydrogenase-like predicted oxidoreductase [Rathayibacter tanaceti]
MSGMGSEWACSQELNRRMSIDSAASPSTTRAPLGDSGIDVFPLSLGGNVFGWTAGRQTSFDVLDGYVAAGGDFIDTADSYSAWVPGNRGGESETIIGEWLGRRSGSRDDVVIATKVSRHPQFTGLAPDTVRAAARASLERLRTDRIDLYYAHFDDEAVPMEDIARVFSELVDQGLVRAIGVSNVSAERVASWLRIAAEEGLHAPVALQPHYNLVERGIEADLLPLAREAGLAVVPYYALASGFLTGKYRDGSTPEGPRADGAARYLDARGRRVLAALDTAAEAHGVEVATVALAWLRSQPGVVAPIASARVVEQLPALTASAALELSAEELAALDTASRP